MKLIRNTIILSISFTLGRGMSMIWNFYLAKTFANELSGLGIYLFEISQFALFSILAEGNLSYSFQHYISKDNLTEKEAISEYWYTSILLKLFFGAFFSFFLFLTIIISFPSEFINAILFSLALLFYTVGSAPIGLMIAFNNFKVQINAFLLNTFFFTLISLIVLYFYKNLQYVVFVLLFSNLITGLYSFYNGYKAFGIPFKKDNFKTTSKKIISFSIPLLISSFCFTFFYRSDINITALKLDSTYVSYISFSVMLFFIIVDFLWSQFASAMTPNLLNTWGGDNIDEKSNSINQFRFLMSFYTFVSLFFIFFIKLFASYFVNIFFSSNYDFLNIFIITNNFLIGLPFLVAYNFLHRIYLIDKSSLNFMSISLIFLVLKVFTFYMLIGSLEYKYLPIISVIYLIVVYLFFLLFWKKLNQFRKILVIDLLKILIIIIPVFYFINYSENYSFDNLNFFISTLIITTAFLFFKKNLKPYLIKFISLPNLKNS
jgi:O-antigen/teichoic acid export membrane protein